MYEQYYCKKSSITFTVFEKMNKMHTFVLLLFCLLINNINNIILYVKNTVQVEYAMKAVENSSTAIGIKCTDGVVLAVEKLVQSKLYESSSNQRIFNIDLHIGMAIAGLLTDARELVEFARNEAANYKLVKWMIIKNKYI